MKHLDEDELIEQYYRDGTDQATAHLRACRACSASFAEIKRSLDAVQVPSVPPKGPEFGERMWQCLSPQLRPYQKKHKSSRWTGWKFVALAGSCAMLLIAAFVAGRYWERGSNGAGAAANHAQTKQRMVLVVLTDHLDRTERLLVELEHSDTSDRAETAQMQSEARELLASNRLYRSTASNAGDPALAGALDRVEGVLAEIANDPNLTEADLNRVRKDMNTEGILFEIRVLRTHTPVQSKKGATI